jgi:hypothetical protein
MVTAMVEVLDVSKPQEELGPATFDSPAHVSLPCRDLKESIASYVDVLGGELPVNRPIFVSTRIAEINVGIGTKNCRVVNRPRMASPSTSMSALHILATAGNRGLAQRRA